MKQELKDKLELAAKIDEAAQRHTDLGWCRESWFDGKKKACAVAHLIQAYNLPREEVDDMTAYPEIQDAGREIAKDIIAAGRYSELSAGRTATPSPDVIVDFNDNFAVSADDAANQFRLTANRLRSEVYAEVDRKKKAAAEKKAAAQMEENERRWAAERASWNS